MNAHPGNSMSIAARPPDTSPSIFLRMNRTDAAARELAWQEFHRRYAAVIAGFARQLGVRAADVEDVVQDVLVGFYATSPTFVYDASRGSFRGYLKTCAFRAARRRLGRKTRFHGLPLERVDSEAVEVEQAWDDVWEQELLRGAIEDLRREIGQTKAFRAFELYVILDLPPHEVSRQLGLHIDNVYRAKQEIARRLREKLAALRASEG